MPTETAEQHAARIRYLLESLKESHPNPNKLTKKLMRSFEKKLDQLQQTA